jgi:hypothetical protein
MARVATSRRGLFRLTAAVGSYALLVSGCGGDDDASSGAMAQISASAKLLSPMPSNVG